MSTKNGVNGILLAQAAFFSLSNRWLEYIMRPLLIPHTLRESGVIDWRNDHG